MVLMMLASACDGSAPTDMFELSGVVTVLLEGTGDSSPIEGARVTFVSDTRLRAEAITDGDGRYRMRVMTDHPFGQVRAEADGFRAHESTVYFDSPQRRVDIQLRRAVGEP